MTADDRIEIRHKSSKAVIDVDRSAVSFFPDYEPVVPADHPARSASKADWVAYATRPENGLSADEAEAMTRDELVAHFIPSSTEES